MEGYLSESLLKEERNIIKYYPGGTNFKFGGETKIRLIEKLEIPCNTAGRKTTILVDVVDSDIPLLLSKPDIQCLGFRLNKESDTLEGDGRVIELDTNSSGHYYLPVNNCEIEVYNVHFAIEEKSFDQKKKMIHKLHRQFAHPTAKNLKALMKNADTFDSDCEEITNSITEKCEVCKRFKRTPYPPRIAKLRAFWLWAFKPWAFGPSVSRAFSGLQAYFYFLLFIICSFLFFIISDLGPVYMFICSF